MKEQSLNSWFKRKSYYLYTYETKCSKDINRVTFDHRGVFSAFLDVKAEAKFIDEPKSQTAIAKLFLHQFAARRAIVVVEQKLFKSHNALRINITALFNTEDPPLTNDQMAALPTEIRERLIYRSESTQIDEMNDLSSER